jgi:hypothetical protein
MSMFNYFSNRTFSQVHKDPARYLFIRGPVGSGKSSGCIWHCVLNALLQEPGTDGVRRTKFAVIRASYPQLKSTVVRSWKDWFRDKLQITYDTPIRGFMRLPHPDGRTVVEMELVYIALDREEEIDKLQSLELTGAHINEAAEIPQGIFQMLKSRINRFPTPGDGGATNPFIIADYNSPDHEHWLYYLAEEVKPQKHSFYHQPSALNLVPENDPTSIVIDAAGNHYALNPGADNLGHYQGTDPTSPPVKSAVWDKTKSKWWVPHLSPDYYVDMCAGADADWVNVFVLNNYGMVRSGRPVYRDYNDAVHCSKEELKPQAGVPIIIGVDCGLTPAAAFCQYTPTGQLLVFDEICTEDCSLQTFFNDLVWPKLRSEYSNFNFYVVIDPAAVNRSQNDAKAAYEMVKEAGMPYRTAKTNALQPRKEAVTYFLRRQGGFVLSPKCKVLRKGFISEYKFEQIRAAQSTDIMFKEKPEKNFFSHIHDGLQYAALEAAGGRIRVAMNRASAASQTDRRQYTRPADNTAGY